MDFDDEDIQEKISHLSLPVQLAFLKAADGLFDNESKNFINILKDSQFSINTLSDQIRTEQNILKVTNVKLDKMQDDEQVSGARAISAKLGRYLEERENRLNQHGTVINVDPEAERKAVENYLNAVGRLNKVSNLIAATKEMRINSGGGRSGELGASGTDGEVGGAAAATGGGNAGGASGADAIPDYAQPVGTNRPGTAARPGTAKRMRFKENPQIEKIFADLDDPPAQAAQFTSNGGASSTASTSDQSVSNKNVATKLRQELTDAKTDEILIDNLKISDNQARLEQERQADLIEKKKKDRANKTSRKPHDGTGEEIVIVNELMEQSRGADEIQKQSKDAQAQRIIEKLEKKKKVASIEMEQIGDDGGVVDSAETAERKSKKKPKSAEKRDEAGENGAVKSSKWATFEDADDGGGGGEENSVEAKKKKKKKNKIKGATQDEDANNLKFEDVEDQI